MAKRFLTGDGHRVGVGDRVWSANHLPWVIRQIGPMEGLETGSIWAFMDYDPAYEVQDDLESTNFMAEPDFSTYIFKFHPSDGRCEWMGCRYRPWGAR